MGILTNAVIEVSISKKVNLDYIFNVWRNRDIKKANISPKVVQLHFGSDSNISEINSRLNW